MARTGETTPAPLMLVAGVAAATRSAPPGPFEPVAAEPTAAAGTPSGHSARPTKDSP